MVLNFHCFGFGNGFELFCIIVSQSPSSYLHRINTREDNSMTNLQSFAAPLGRVLLAFIFILSGLTKLGDISGTAAYIESGGLPGILVWPTILLEVVGGLMLAVGYKAGLAALGLAGFSLLSGLLYHFIPAGGLTGMEQQMQMIMFFKNVSIAGGLLIVFALGSGPYSVARGSQAVTA